GATVRIPDGDAADLGGEAGEEAGVHRGDLDPAAEGLLDDRLLLVDLVGDELVEVDEEVDRRAGGRDEGDARRPGDEGDAEDALHQHAPSVLRTSDKSAAPSPSARIKTSRA